MKHSKLEVKTIVIVYRPDTKEAIRLSNELSQWLKKKNITTFSHPDQTIESTEKISDISEADLVIVLGGDGTYLEAVRFLKGRDTPILGINLGSLGFLTENQVDNLYPIVEQAINSQLEMRPRLMLEIMVKQKSQTHSFTALNDVVFERGAQSQLVSLSVFGDEHLITSLKADGLIFSSPTGSTAYNLAAGGPILHPEIKAFTMTPICAHSLTDRPAVFPENQIIRIKNNNPNQKIVINADGRRLLEFSHTDEAILKKANCDHSVLRKPSHNYFDLLREKLKFGERA